MNKFFNEVSVRYLSSVVVASKNTNHNLASNFEVSMLNIDIAQYGYTFSNEVLEVLHTMSKKELNDFSETLNVVMEEFKRTDVRSVPLFKRFPYNTELSDHDYFEKRISGLVENIIMHATHSKERKNNYTMLSCGHLINETVFNLAEFGACPICQHKVEELDTPVKDLPPLENTTPLTILSLSSNKDVFAVFKDIVNSKIAYSPDFRNIIDGFFNACGSNIKGLLPREIPIKENAAYITSKLFEVEGKKAIKFAKSYIKTSTDVLRLAVSFSDGDLSLAENTDFKLSNGQRRLIMALLDNVKSSMGEDMLRNKEGWLRLSKTLHIGAYKETYPMAFAEIDKLRNSPNLIKTFNSAFETALMANRYDKNALPILLDLATQRPGVFARYLDFVLRTNPTQQDFVLSAFADVVPQVSTNVLLSVYKHIINRNNLKERLFIPKGNVISMQFGSAPVGEFSDSVLSTVTELVQTEVQKRFSERETFDNVYIDPSIDNMVVPFAMRSNSEGSLNMTRGSRIKIEDKTDVVGFFINWHDAEDRTIDLDLSAVFLNEKYEQVSSVSYSDYNSKSTGAYFSGDVQSGGGKHGGYEGINIDLKSSGIKENIKHGARYVAMSVIVYAGTAFNGFESLAGYQEREKLKGGDALEASKVKTKFAITGSGRSCVPLLFDLETREIIWVDAHMKSNSLSFNNIRTEAKGIKDIVKAFVEIKKYKLTMQELMQMHYPRFSHIDFKKDPEKEYDLVIDKNFALNLPDVVANWL